MPLHGRLHGCQATTQVQQALSETGTGGGGGEGDGGVHRCMHQELTGEMVSEGCGRGWCRWGGVIGGVFRGVGVGKRGPS